MEVCNQVQRTVVVHLDELKMAVARLCFRMLKVFTSGQVWCMNVAKLKECLVCCRCKQVFYALDRVDLHAYREFNELYPNYDVGPISNWRCFGCLEVFDNFIDYYQHFEKVYRAEEEVEKEERGKYERLSELCERQRDDYDEVD